MIGKVFAMGLLGVGMAMGQAMSAPATAAAAATTPAKPMAFEAVSIRPSNPGSPWGRGADIA